MPKDKKKFSANPLELKLKDTEQKLSGNYFFLEDND